MHEHTPPGPIARKLLAVLQAGRRRGLNLQEMKRAQRELAVIQSTGPSKEELSALRPEHALYVSVHNMVMDTLALTQEEPALTRIAERMGKADEQYMPMGPPMSPLTHSFFCSWMLYDVGYGPKQETFGAIMRALSIGLELDAVMSHTLGLLSESRLGFFIHVREEPEGPILREEVTGTVHHCLCPAGHKGAPGELWLARVLPPPAPGMRSLVFTTPYVILAPDVEAWRKYFERVQPKTKRTHPVEAYTYLMKRGLLWNYWAEYVFEAYSHHRAEVIFLEGLPDVARSRPQSRPNSILP